MREAQADLRGRLRSARLAVPLCVLAALAAVRLFDVHLYDFLGHLLLATTAMLLLGVAGASYARDSDGFFRYLGYALPWLAILQFAEAFLHSRAPHEALLAESLTSAAWLTQGAVFVGAGLYAGRRVTVLEATLPWGAATLALFTAIVGGLVLPAPLLQLCALALLFAALGLAHRRRATFDEGTYALVQAGIGLSVLSQVLVLASGHTSGWADVTGFAPRLIGLWLLYVAGNRALVAAPGGEPVHELIFQGSAIGLSLSRQDGSFITVNPAFARIYGFDSPGQMLAEAPNATQLYADPADRARIVEEIRRDGFVRADVRIRHRNGSLRWVRSTAVPLRNRAGAPVGYQSAVFDITEAKESDERAALQDRRLRRLFDVLPVGVWLVDEAGKVVLGNQAIQRIWGHGGRMNVEDLAQFKRRWLATGKEVTPEDWPVLAALRGGKTRLNDEMEIDAFDGQRKIVRNSAAPIVDEAGAVLGAFLVKEDITAAKRHEAELRRYEALVESSDDAIFQIAADGRLSSWNAGAKRLLGYAPEEVIGAPLESLLPAALRGSEGALLRGALQGEPIKGYETTHLRKDGCPVRVSLGVSPVRDSAGRVVGAAAIARDITAREAAEVALREREQELQAVVENSPDVIARWGTDLRCRFVNRAVTASTGLPVEAFLGKRIEEMGQPVEFTEGYGRALEQVLASAEALDVELRHAAEEGDRFFVVRMAPERDAQDQVRSILAISHDITERKRYEKQIEHIASHDALTGLPNRALLSDRVEQAISHARRAHNFVGLLFVDLDRFKLVNDSWGHTFGDALLVETAQRLQQLVRDGDTVARLGGDEFVVLLPQLARAADGARVAEKAAAAIAAPFEIEGRELLCTASIGISVFPEDGGDLDALLRCADAAMYRAKDLGRSGYQFYRKEMGVAARERVSTETALRQALSRGELRLHYQPQVALASGKVTGFEALLRWERPGDGLVGPGSFVPVAEDIGLIVPIGQWALHEASRQLAAWRLAGFDGLRVSVNLSARQLGTRSLAAVVAVALEEARLPASCLEVEITESAVVKDLAQAMQTLKALRDMGVSVAIDDFGTGYSSLAYLRSLPINKVKIDKSFLAGAPDDPQAAALVAEIVRLAHVLRLEVVAEGVERMEQAVFLRDVGCEALQGFLFSRPVPPADCRSLLERSDRLILPVS